MAASRSLLFVVLILHCATTHILACTGGPPVVQCHTTTPTTTTDNNNCNVYNSQGSWEGTANCTASSAFFPQSEAELVQAVAFAAKRNLKVKVIGPLAHSRAPLMCAGNDHGGVVISTKHLNSKRSVNRTAGTITVHAGVNMKQLQDAVGAAGVSFPTSTSWNGISAAGAISTGAHGSGLFGKGSSIHEYVVGLRLVVPATAAEGYAKVVELRSSDEDLKAAMLSLGVLGAISEVKFSVEPLFKRSVSVALEDDTGLEDRLVTFLNRTEFPNVYWYASQGMALMGTIDRVSTSVPGNGTNKSSYQPTTVASVRRSAEKAEEIEKNEDSVQLCNQSKSGMKNRVGKTGGFFNDGQNFTKYPVIGYNHFMINAGGCENYDATVKNDSSSTCLPEKITDENEKICSWDRRADPRQTWDFEFRVPLSRAADAMRDIKKIREVSNVTRAAFCSIEGSGFVMRTLKKSEAFLGPPEDAVTFEMSYYRSEQASVPKWNMDVFTEIEQLLLEKYGAHLHWGKSGGYYFDGQAKMKTVSLTKFENARRRYDPQGLFLNEWTEKILGIGGKKIEEVRDGCALDKLCKCSKDSHCAPSKGYLCRPGRVYTAARVCRKETPSESP